MQWKTVRWSALGLAVALLMTALPVTAAPQDDDEHKIVVDVRRGGGPRLWTSLQGGYLGINMVDLTPELRAHFGAGDDAGVMISRIADDSPAAACGLQVGDILTSIDGASISGSNEVVQQIGSKESGESVTLEVFRAGSYMNLEATLEERERPQMWLNRIDEEGHHSFEFQTGDGENVFFLPGPESGQLRVERKRIDELMGNLHERLASPEFSERMFEVRSNTEELEARIKELEKKLQELAEKLEAVED